MRNQEYRIRKMPKAKFRTCNFSLLLIILTIKNTLLEKRQPERNNKLTKFLGCEMNLSYAHLHPPSALDLIPLRVWSRARRVQDFWIRTRILSYTLNTSKKFCYAYIYCSLDKYEFLLFRLSVSVAS